MAKTPHHPRNRAAVCEADLGQLERGLVGLEGYQRALVGERLLQALKVREIAPLWAAGLGTLLITLIGTGLSVAFCLALLPLRPADERGNYG